jgi:hypothetical protein
LSFLVLFFSGCEKTKKLEDEPPAKTKVESAGSAVEPTSGVHFDKSSDVSPKSNTIQAEKISCAKPPAVTMCCQALIPSCESCKARNARMQLEWKKQCDSSQPK